MKLFLNLEFRKQICFQSVRVKTSDECCTVCSIGENKQILFYKYCKLGFIREILILDNICKPNMSRIQELRVILNTTYMIILK